MDGGLRAFLIGTDPYSTSIVVLSVVYMQTPYSAPPHIHSLSYITILIKKITIFLDIELLFEIKL